MLLVVCLKSLGEQVILQGEVGIEPFGDHASYMQRFIDGTEEVLPCLHPGRVVVVTWE